MWEIPKVEIGGPDVKPTMKPMKSAPKDGSDIEVWAHGKWFRVSYHDCQWMRDDPSAESIADAWAVDNLESPGHIELNEAEGWRPITDEA